MADVVGRLFREFAITLGVTILVVGGVSHFDAHDVRAAIAPRSRVAAKRIPSRIAACLRPHERGVRQNAAARVGSPDPHAGGGGRNARLERTPVRVRAQGFFPDPRLRRHSRHFASPSVDLVWSNGRTSARVGKVILDDPAVESLSSFIGVDGINTTLNSGRILINLKALTDRKDAVRDVMRRLTSHLAKVPGIALYLQPVQDLTVDARVSRTQYQLSLETPDPKALDTWAPQSSTPCAACRSWST